ncbi:putative proline-rich receptor-like protein kinase PERK3 [Iris pallida]|uniref:Proline-rich receptor-like protein kinase PERK3 n=1 Tax=Iris pallida TaxID=29817 RepID=A0AAX6EF21_IRIPA|nr:putative proline-rich receptor-like protein kinase PERK3 [Iris pallida]
MADPGRTQPYDPSSNTDHPLLGSTYFPASSREVCRPLLRADRRSLRAGAASTPSSPVSLPQRASGLLPSMRRRALPIACSSAEETRSGALPIDHPFFPNWLTGLCWTRQDGCITSKGP